jgi:TRAP-type C4-dicarboxylate transport system permease small subunit
MPSSPSASNRIAFFFNRLEEILLCFLLILMVLLGFIQILFRNVISVGLYWIDPLLRHSVLWVALLGASAATREDRHISIDLLSGRLGPRIRYWVQTVIHLFAAIVCFLLIMPAVQFVQDEYQVGKVLALGIPVWVSQSIIPVMLVVLSLRFLGKAWAFLKKAISGPIQMDKKDI